MSLTATLRAQLRPIYVPIIERSPALSMLALVAEGAVDRKTDYVHDGYMEVWGAYEERLARCKSFDEWLFIPGFDDVPHAYHIDGRIRYTVFDHTSFEIDTIASWIEEHFPNARSITEYGCGVGRNMLAIKRRFPHFDCYGYELAEAGVEVARKAAAKFGMDVKYAPLDYVKDGADKYVHPRTDLALTVYSLEQVPYAGLIGARNMLDHANMGSIHLEPVSENYPLNYRGMMGRLHSYQVDYLKNFDGGVRSLALREVRSKVLDTAHNPLMYPTIYALIK